MAEIAVELQSTIESRDEAAGSARELRATLLAVETRAGETAKDLEAVRRASAAAESRVLEALRDLKAERGALTASEARAAETQTALESKRSALAALESRAAETGRALEAERAASVEARALMELLNRQVAALRTQLRGVQAALDASDAQVKDQKLKVADLGRRLNVALAAKVQELKSYRSEFFGRLRGLLSKRTDVRIVGDRFVFQSEVLFPTASARLEPGGRAQLAKLARTLKEISGKIPEGLDWVLRVDGHTDRRPIITAEFPSNWELSTARALSVVRFLVSQGIPPARLAATGFGEFQPLEDGDTEAAYGKNRRIELKLTQR